MRVAVVGAGIVGLAVARSLRDAADVDVYEKEDDVAAHQTGHNSGVVHAGLYYEPGSLKARLCLRGATLLREYAAARGVAYDECGKVVVALHPSEVGRMRAILGRARANGVPGVREVGAAELREIEPHAVGLAAVHSPRTGIVDYVGIALSVADVLPGPRGIRAQAMDRGGRLLDDFAITGRGRVVHVRNAPSPGATSALAIAEHVVAQALGRL